jgi:hypothetical protein
MGAKPKDRGSPSKTKKAKAEKPQKERFIETARKIGVDETGKEFERLFAKIAPPKKPAS